jgi:RNA polymerase sigma-70 factor (ECF subfamily)
MLSGSKHLQIIDFHYLNNLIKLFDGFLIVYRDMKLTKNSSDFELIEACRLFDRMAQKCLYEKYFGKMFGVAMRYTQNQEEALDILNSSFLKVFTSLDKYQDNNLGGWIARIVFNTAIDHIRRNSRYRQLMDFNVERDAVVSNDSFSRLQAEEIYQMIQKLPTASRTVFNLYVIDGYKHKEISELLNISVGTSKWHLSNARKELQQMIGSRNNYESLRLSKVGV